MCNREEGNPLVLCSLEYASLDVYAHSTRTLIQQSKLGPDGEKNKNNHHTHIIIITCSTQDTYSLAS